jgi:RimJ/RimL family protein N-acetyltransferase
MIETARLSLSAWTEAEREDFVAMCADPEVMHDYGGAWDRAAAEARFERNAARLAQNGFCKWIARRKADGAFLGYCGVDPIWPTLAAAPGLEIGWRMVRTAWGHGYASEAARAALVDIFARTPADEVISFTSPTNKRSQAVMRRIGLVRAADRDFVYETGEPAIVFVAPRARFAAAAD